MTGSEQLCGRSSRADPEILVNVVQESRAWQSQRGCLHSFLNGRFGHLGALAPVTDDLIGQRSL